ncbi:KinB-signaling pathway activation protein [Aquibacillus sediminis]|uniref:KinB-signaling pathway activation protein n=1 Tax=Aquibacillus sediminis TaxID=2574734 RepID=UPI0011099804|nr:KinB-signaling pathway activation protein [Aquibacillus sediminis]
MKSRNLVRLFFTTLLIGGISTLLTSFFVKSETYAAFLNPIDVFEIFGLLIFFIGLGFVFSLVSQMGFFAYLTINQFGLGMFRGLWGPIQVILIGVTLFDLVYFRYKGSDGETSIYIYILVAVAIFVYGWIISGIKAKETNRKAFIPALFFMIVITTIEWVPGLRASGNDYTWLMIIPLLVCNTYQLLVLHRITERK